MLNINLHKTKILFILGSLLIVIGIAWFVFSHHKNRASFDGEPVLVQAAHVEASVLPQEIHALGSLKARSVEITPEVAGHVEKIFFQDGAFVKQGTILIQLDDAVYQSKYASSKAKYIYSEGNFKRMTLLGKQGAVTQQAIDQAEADLKEKKADMDESEVMMNKMKLIAPFDGVLGKNKINTGEYITIGQGVVTLTDIEHLRIEYNIPEKYLPLIQLKQSVMIKTSAYANKNFTGQVSFISPTIDTSNRSIAIYAELNNENNLLKPGMFVDVTQLLNNTEKVLVVPAKSLVPVLDGQQVYKIIDGKAYAANVIVGKRIADRVEILQGLLPNDIIITDGQFKVRNNMPVKIN
jgi:membrane fusion protein (multidrug efflux system)